MLGFLPLILNSSNEADRCDLGLVNTPMKLDRPDLGAS